MTSSDRSAPVPTVLDRVLEISDLLQRDMERAFAGTGLTSARTHLLWVLHHAGPSTQRVLATALDVSARNITGLVDALEATGHVARGPHPTDRRATVVSLTEIGAAVMERMAAEHVQLSGALVEGLDRREAESLLRGLDHVAGVLRTLVEAAAVSSAASSASLEPAESAGMAAVDRRSS